MSSKINSFWLVVGAAVSHLQIFKIVWACAVKNIELELPSYFLLDNNCFKVSETS